MKHLFFKSVFLLALGSGKRRSEIHALQNKKTKLNTNPIGQRCPRIQYPALNPRISWPRGSRQCGPSGYNSPGPHLWIDLLSLTCPSFRLEHCATIWTGPQTSSRIRRWFLSPLRKVSRKTFASISSWIKQTVILYYELSDQEAHSLHQVKTHDVRAFLLLPRFSSRECHLVNLPLKSHNTLTQFYLKGMAWADSELYQLGSVLAAQQIHRWPLD